MADVNLIIRRHGPPQSSAVLVLTRQARQTRQCLHLRRDVAAVTRREMHLLRDVVWETTRQCLHLLYIGRDYVTTRQCLHLRRRPASATRRCLHMWRDIAYAPRQCLHLLRDALPMPRQCLHLWRDALPATRQCLHLQRDAAVQVRQCLHLLRDALPATRQCLHLQRDAAVQVRQCLHLLRDALPATRQCLHLQRDAAVQTRQALHLLRDSLPATRQCLHLRRDKYPLVRRCLHLLRNAEHAVSPSTAVTIAGTPVSPISIRVTESADQAAISATLEFAEALPPGLGPPAPMVIEIFGIRYELQGESYSRSREFGARSWTLTAASPAYRLQSRYADDVDGELVGMASAVARSLAGGIPVDWRMVDWDVRPGRLAPDGQAPLEVLRNLVSAAGGIMTSNRDGSIAARPWPPYRPADWPAHIEAETDSLSAMISIQDDDDARDLRNAVTVRDETGTGDLRIEEIPDTRIGNRAEVWVYQVPWRDDFDVRHTAAGLAVLQDLGVEERTIEAEMLEIVDGEGKTQWPIYGIVTARWNKIDLGAITPAEDGTITTEIRAESLLYLTYRTKARRLLVDMREEKPEPIMLIAEDF